MPIYDERAERAIPDSGLVAYRRFWRHLKVAAEVEHIDISPRMRNAIRNAWCNGYWTGRDTPSESS